MPLRFLAPLTLVLLAAVLATPLTATADEPRRLLLLGQGPDGHAPTTHEFVAGLRVIEHCLRDVPGLQITTALADEPWSEGPELLAAADGVVLFLAQGALWLQNDPRRQQAFAQFAQRGGGLSALHWAIGTKPPEHIEGFVALLGACHGGPDRRFKVLETTLRPAGSEHPIVSGVGPLQVRDEFYYALKGIDQPGIAPLMQAEIEGEHHTVAWAWQRPDGGRSFGFSGLHFHDNWRHVEYRRLAAQGILWTLALPIPAGGLPVDIDDATLHLDE